MDGRGHFEPPPPDLLYVHGRAVLSHQRVLEPAWKLQEAQYGRHRVEASEVFQLF